MTILTWRKEPPDREGVWAWSDDGVSVTGVTSSLAFAKPAAFWCRIGDVPEIKPEVKYREPTAADVLAAGGRLEAEVRDSEEREWTKRMLVAVLPADMIPRFRCRGSENKAYLCAWRHARIVDEKREAREIFVNEYGPGLDGNCFSDLSTAQKFGGPSAIRTVKFREVI